MKILWIFLFLPGLSALGADSNRPRNCRFLHNFLVMQKLGDHSYEISMRGLGYNSPNETVLLETTKMTFESSGKASISVVPIGKRKTTMKDGFEKLLQVYREAPECEVPTKTSVAKKPKKVEPTVEDKLEKYQWRYVEESTDCEKEEDGPIGDFKNAVPPGSNIVSQSDSRVVFRIQAQSKPNIYYTSEEACKSDKDRSF